MHSRKPFTHYNPSYTQANKAYINRILVRLATKMDSQPHFLVLDRAFNTTNTILSKLPKSCIDIYEINEVHFNHMKDRLHLLDSTRVYLYNQNIKCVNENVNTYDVVYLDLCCTLRLSLPIVSKVILNCNNTCIFAITESLRDPVINRAKALLGLESLFEKNDYYFEEIEVVKYKKLKRGSPMITRIYMLTKFI